MSFNKASQDLVVVDPQSHQQMDLVPLDLLSGNHMHHHGEEPLQVLEDSSDGLEIEEHMGEAPLEIHLDVGPHIEVNLPAFEGDLPGAPDSPEPIIEVEEDDEDSDSKSDDKNDVRKKKKESKWDWESRGPEGFVDWIKERFDDVPKHSGKDTAGVERAIAYLDRLDSEISKAMRSDLDGSLDSSKVATIRERIEDGLDKLEARLEKLSKKNKKKADAEHPLVKEAQKITGVKGVVITVSLFISTLARICVNGSVSAGHDINTMYQKLVKKYKLDDREQLELVQVLLDLGYPLNIDRGLIGEEIDVTSVDNYDWMANYSA